MKTSLLEPGKVYHIYNRAKNGDPLFFDDEDRRFFMKLYTAHVSPVADTFAYCLLNDHLHLLIRMRPDAEGSLYKPFAMLFNGYSKGFNQRHAKEGRVFLFKLKRIEIRKGAYVADMVRYINQNACKHGLADDPMAFRYSSLRASISPYRSMISRDELVRYFGGSNLVTGLMQPVNESSLKYFMME
jgi:REP element-mobilizing transposase RayT